MMLAIAGQTIYAQERIDGTVSFQSDPAKQYSIYVPSSYQESTPNKLMLGLHPFNTNRWNSISWCDTLIAFAEANDLLLFCPDGGADGKVDDPIDTAFTTVMLDSMLDWYTVDESKIFAMGFSWGGRTTYSYGLNHHERFAGFLPIGAAVNGTDEVDGVLDNAEGLPFYIVHGSFDNPNIRFHPVRNALNDAEACVETELMTGVGHTIDFPNRNAILTQAFEWIDSVSCGITSSTLTLIQEDRITVFPNPVGAGQQLNVDAGTIDGADLSLRLLDLQGKEMRNVLGKSMDTSRLPPGVYLMEVRGQSKLWIKKVVIE